MIGYAFGMTDPNPRPNNPNGFRKYGTPVPARRENPPDEAPPEDVGSKVPTGT